MKKCIISICVCAFCLCGCTTARPVNPNVCDSSCIQADMSGYESFTDKDHVFYEISMDTANNNLLNPNFTGILYYGYITCPWCNEALPLMNTAAKEKNVKIYYIDKHSDLNSEHPEWEEEAKKILSKSFTLDKNSDGKETLFVPEVVVIKEGKIVDHHMGTFDEHNAHERKMTKKERQTLLQIYKDMFEKIVE